MFCESCKMSDRFVEGDHYCECCNEFKCEECMQSCEHCDQMMCESCLTDEDCINCGKENNN